MPSYLSLKVSRLEPLSQLSQHFERDFECAKYRVENNPGDQTIKELYAHFL